MACAVHPLGHLILEIYFLLLWHIFLFYIIDGLLYFPCLPLSAFHFGLFGLSL